MKTDAGNFPASFIKLQVVGLDKIIVGMGRPLFEFNLPRHFFR
jgi:hypothetical protein